MEQDMKTGCVYLVGAGCGKYDLITLRGMQRLQNCDAVVYDDLLDTELLSAAPVQAQRIYVGKRLGRHKSSQEDISRLLVDMAQQGNRVVRLKGGDPFVFGRGGEEIQALQQAGIPYEEIPGISSAIAIPALAGIPVTHRGVSQSLHIITAHTAGTEDGLPACLDRLANLNGTLVFLMGLSQLPAIVHRLLASGMPADTPAAVISGADISFPAAVRARLGLLEEAVRSAEIQPPAIILVGAVAALDFSSTISELNTPHPSIWNGEPHPLSGVRIALTGTADVLERLRSALSALGAQTTVVSSSRIRALPAAFDMRSLYQPCWIVLTSRNGVACFFRQLADSGVDLRKLHSCRFAVIGPGTASALQHHGIFADLCPEDHSSLGLSEALMHTVQPEELVYLFRSTRGAPILERRLSTRCRVQNIPLYEVVPNAIAQATPGPAEYIIFCSASGVNFYLDHYGSIPEGAVCVCIGPVTAQALAKRSNAEVLTADEISLSGIVQTILKDHTKGERDSP